MLALILLMTISKFREFTPIRDRINLASYKKDKTDYILYRVEDLHWFMIIVQQVSLVIMVIISKKTFIDVLVLGRERIWYRNLDFELLIFIRYALEIYYVKRVFFESGPLKLNKRLTYALGPITLLINLYIIFFGFRRNPDCTFTQSFYLQEIGVQFAWMYLVLVEIKLWPLKKKRWMK
jgi:hypothetical protein